MLIPKKVEKALNDHLALEMAAIYHYLAVASWCEKESFEGSASFFFEQSQEEHQHFMKIFTYINEMGGHAVVPELKKPRSTFSSILEACEKSLEAEKKVTQSIYQIVDIAYAEHDHATVEFLKFFIDEQREGEVKLTRLIDKIKLIGEGPQSLYYIDKEVERAASGGEKKKKKETEN
ncbi:MAG: ferritin [Chitinophagales bacterium]|nr:ferritin [Chitinophagales bacterium]MDW8274389.1 ferritin [Chitinophagales bacterium]